MKQVYIRGPATRFIDEHQLDIDDHILGVYVPSEETSYIFLDEIKQNAIKQWLFNKTGMFQGNKGLQRLFIRLRKLVEYHEYAHHMQYVKGKMGNTQEIRMHNEYTADRYAMMRYMKDYHRAPGVKFNR